MPTRFLCSLLLALLFLPAGRAQPPVPKEELNVKPPPEKKLPPPLPTSPPLAPLPPLVEGGCAAGCCARTIPSTQVLLVPHERATTLPDWKLRDVECDRVPGGPVLDFVEEKQCVTELKLESRDVPQQVVCTESKPVTVTDPCTGKCHTEYVPCEVVKTVVVKVYETVPVQRTVIVRRPCLKQGPDLIVKKLVLDKRTIPAIETTFTAVTTNNELHVPACPPLPCPLPGHP